MKPDALAIRGEAVWSMEAERALIGGALVAADEVPALSQAVAPADFFATEYGHAWRCIADLASRGEPVDAATVGAALERLGDDAAARARQQLAEIAATVETTTGLLPYARIVREHAMRRRIAALCTRAMRAAAEGTLPPAELAGRLATECAAVAAGATVGGPVRLSDAMPALLERTERQKQAGPDAPTDAVPTGLVDVDRALAGGFARGDLVLLGGRPSMGKTALALRVMRGALDSGGSVLFFSLEQPKDQILLRAWSADARVDMQRLRRPGYLSDSDWMQLAASSERLSRGWPGRLWIDDAPGRTPADVRQTALALCSRVGNLRLVVLDYLQLMNLEGDRGRNREQDVSMGSRALKNLARELAVPVLALCQLSRKCEERSDKRPVLSDLRDSGALEQDADVILFLYRDEVYAPNIEATQGVAELRIAKQRNGPLAKIDLAFRAPYTDFENLAQADRLPLEPAQRPEPVRLPRARQRNWTDRADAD